jgi:hypothetical protein
VIWAALFAVVVVVGLYILLDAIADRALVNDFDEEGHAQ